MKKIFTVVLTLVIILNLCACASPSKAIIGTWKSQTTVLGVVTETSYTFNEDGTGEKTTVLDVPFTYTISKDKLIITTTVLGISTSEEYSFDFSGNKLVLSGDQDTIVLVKNK